MKFTKLVINQEFKYGGVRFVKTALKTITGPRRVNALRLAPGCVVDNDRYFFSANDEVTVC